MAYSVDWITKVISVPTADLTLVSGTRYSLDMADFLAEARRLEWEFSEGLWAPSIVDHTNTRYDFAGVNYAPFDDLLNDYTVEFTGVATRVDLLGSNNDIIDVLIPTGVSVVPSNSAGLQIVVTGSVVTQQDKDEITAGVWLEPEAVILRKMVYNKTAFNDVSKILTIYEDNGVDVWKQFDLTDKGRVEV
jgi:hypothetical protein